jgi:hypothetical protein
MPLRVPTPPEQGAAIVLEALSSAINQPTTAAAAVADADPQNLATAAPHQVYFVGLRDLAAGRLLAAAHLKGWRYIIFEGEQPLAVAELSGGGEALSFSNINRGPFVASTIEGVSRAEGLDEVRTEDFELRLLDLPGLYVVALWLHGARDLIIPLPPTRQGLEPFAVYEEAAVIERLRGPAERRLSSDDRPRRRDRR